MKNARKRYVVCLTNTDGSIQEPLWLSNTRPLLSDGDQKFVAPSTEDDRAEFFSANPKAHIPRHVWPVITRRAVARRLARAATARWYGANTNRTARVVELGTFKRDVRPIKHWNIERTMARLDTNGKRIEPFSGNVIAVHGVEVREVARAHAKEMTYLHEQYKEKFLEHYKFKAVPVYAEVK